MKLALVLTSILLIHTTQGGEKAKLPADSQAALQQFRALEAREMRAVQERLELKRKELFATLQKHLDRETRAGRLDEALALRNSLASLGVPSSESPAAVSAASDNQLAPTALYQKRFKMTLPDNREYEIEFGADKKITYLQGKPDSGMKHHFAQWELNGATVRVLNNFNAETGTFPFDLSRRTLTFKSNKGVGFLDRTKLQPLQ